MRTSLTLALLLACWPAAATPNVELANLNGLVVSRDAITGQIELHKNGRLISVEPGDRTRFYLHGGFRFAGRSFILVYDVIDNKPSGSGTTSKPDEDALYEIVVDKDAAAFRKVAALPMGIDIQLRTSGDENAMLACGTTTCLRLTKAGDNIAYEQVSIPAGTELIELAGQRVLVQKSADPLPPADATIFSVCQLGEASNCADIPADVIPYDLAEDGTYKTAKTAAEFETVLRFDFDRLGDANYSEPNLEARLVWSNVYYLNGLAALYKLPFSDGFREVAKLRLTEEFKAIAALGQTVYPGFKVRRYSVAREPIEFLLHYSRIAKTALRARPVIGDEAANAVVSLVKGEIENPTRTMEEVITSPRAEVRYRKYSPFWADGSNVPWNYQNAWIEAISMIGIPEEKGTTIAAMVKTFVTEEKLADHPNTWRYSTSDFYDGWAEGVSYNTPIWAGGKNYGNATAHISYRSMDALALLEADKAGIETILDLRGYISSLMKSGYLYPFVNEGMDEQVEIPFAIARNYARSSLPWEFQNQVWAIASLKSAGASLRD